MAVIYRTTDRVLVEIEDISLKFAPLSEGDKMKLINLFSTTDFSKDPAAALKHSKELIMLTLKDVDGVELSDGSKWHLEFEEGKVKSSSIDELLSLDLAQKIVIVAGQFLRSVPRVGGGIIDPSTGEKLEGVEVKKAV